MSLEDYNKQINNLKREIKTDKQNLEWIKEHEINFVWEYAMELRKTELKLILFINQHPEWNI